MKRRARSSLFASSLVGAMFCTSAPSARAQTPDPDASRASAHPRGERSTGPTTEATGAGARAADVALAERYAAAAFEAYRVRDYGRAVSLYEQALAVAPSADILYNLARVHDVGLRDRRRAIEYYERYTAEPAAAPGQIATATQRLDELRAAELASLGAVVEDGPGIARDFPLDAPTIAAPSHARPANARGLRPLQVTALALGGVGLVGLGVGVSYGLWAGTEQHTWQSACDGNACTSQRGVEAAEAAARRAGIATLGFALGGGLLAAGAVSWLLDKDLETASSAAGLRFTPMVQGSRVGGHLSGQF